MVKRNANVDLFRIIATLFVVMLHVLDKGGILTNTSPNDAKYWVAWFLYILTYCAVNCFALISGYVMVNKEVKAKSIINLWFQVIFYSVLLAAIVFVLKPTSRSLGNLVRAVLPVIGKQWWYISSYFALFFFIPFLNKAVQHISQQTYRKALIAILIGACCMDSYVQRNAFNLRGGYSAIWLIVLYLFGAYIRKYDLQKKITAGKSLLGFVAMLIITFGSKLVIHFATSRFLGAPRFDNRLVVYTSITIVFAAIFLFLFCLNLKIGTAGEKWIRFFAPATLGVYLIHVHQLVFDYYIQNSCVWCTNYSLPIMLAGIFGCTIGIYLVCSLLDLLRIQLFKLLRVHKWSEGLAKQCHRVYLKLFPSQS